ncbi:MULTISPECIES: hypothetical protein [unclassified Streptomyces]|uniref:hypothetical protein n=1 Tax=unclassified Streptomyces TaxID=2593676 RepID=UPI002E27D44D|nr:hypothetical protein [Streptomyces sp. NBC_01439]
MATLRERKTYRDQVLRVLYEAVEGNRLLGITGAQLRRDLHVPEQDLAAACTYLAGEGLITVDWDPGNTPAMVTLTHEGIRHMEADEESTAEPPHT